jgi:hypothetical protein
MKPLPMSAEQAAAACRELLHVLQPWTNLTDESRLQAIASAYRSPTRALACYRAITYSLVPR